MAELKTQRNDASVDDFLATIDDEARRRDCQTIRSLMQRITGSEAEMWGTAIVGFGSYHYRYASGREGDWMLSGFSPRKRELVVYIMAAFSRFEEIVSRLGKHRKGKSCLYLRRLDDIELEVLEELVAASVDTMRRQYL